MGYIALGVLALAAGLTVGLLGSDGPKPIYFMCTPVRVDTQSSGLTPAAAVHAYLRERGHDSHDWLQSSGSRSEAIFGRLVPATAPVSEVRTLGVTRRANGRWQVRSRCDGSDLSSGRW
jgi:hypothetical protein